jgi:hypothetical protein
VFIASQERKIVHRARTHINALHDLIAKLENALYASGHLLVFPFLILDEVRPVSGGRVAKGHRDGPHRIWNPLMPLQ